MSSVISGSFASVSFFMGATTFSFFLLFDVDVVVIMVDDARLAGAEKRVSILLLRNSYDLFDSQTSRILSLVSRFVAFASFVCVVCVTKFFRNR